MEKNELIKNDVLNRIKTLMDVEGMNKKAFTDHIGFHYSNFGEILNGTRGVPKSLLNKIRAGFPDLRNQWLLFGDGEMYISEQEAANAEAIKEQSAIATRPRIPLGWVSTEPNEDIVLSKFEQVPMMRGVPDYDLTAYVLGDSMSPKYEPNDEIALKEVETIYEWGKDYLLCTNVGAFLRKLYPAAGDKIKCVAYNEAYPDFELPKNEIRHYFKVVGLQRLV